MTEWLTLSLSNVLLAVKLCNQPVSHNHFSTSPATATWWLPGFSTESEHTRLPADPSLAFLMPLGIQADDQHGPEEPENGSRCKKFTAHSPSRTFTCPSSRTQAHTHDSSEARADWNLLLIHFQNSHLPSRRSINKALNTAREGWSWVSTVPLPMDVKTGKAEWDGTDLFSDLFYSLATVTETLWATIFSSMKVKVLVTQSCPTLCDPMDCSLPGFSVHGILQARILEWIAIPSSRGSSQPRDHISSIRQGNNAYHSLRGLDNKMYAEHLASYLAHSRR